VCIAIHSAELVACREYKSESEEIVLLVAVYIPDKSSAARIAWLVLRSSPCHMLLLLPPPAHSHQGKPACSSKNRSSSSAAAVHVLPHRH
jgi:hypothetical protein